MDIFRNENDIDETQNDWINKMKLLEIVIQIPFNHNQSLPKKIQWGSIQSIGSDNEKLIESHMNMKNIH